VLTIINPVTDSVLKLVPVLASNYFTIHYNPEVEKLYALAGGQYCDYVTVVSGRDDSVIKTLETPMVGMACQNPARSDVFMFAEQGVAVMDGLRDSVFKYISVPGSSMPCATEYDVSHDKVYCSAESSVTIIDALTYRATRTIPVGQLPNDMISVPRHNRVFVANAKSSSITVICDTSLAIEEQQDVAPLHSSPTVVRAEAILEMGASSILIDVAGRRLGVLDKGTCRFQLPGPGVYYLTPVGGGASRKLVCVE
jgi:YVTN family beta-propeller protein